MKDSRAHTHTHTFLRGAAKPVVVCHNLFYLIAVVILKIQIMFPE